VRVKGRGRRESLLSHPLGLASQARGTSPPGGRDILPVKIRFSVGLLNGEVLFQEKSTALEADQRLRGAICQ